MRKTWSGYLVAVVSTLFVTIVRFEINDYTNYTGPNSPYLFFLISVMVSAWFGGIGPAVVAIVLGGISGMFYFAEPAGVVAFDNTPDVTQLILFFLQGAIISGLSWDLYREKQLAQDRLSQWIEATKKTESILESTSEGIFTLDENGEIQSWNRAAAEIFQYRADEILGRNISLLILMPMSGPFAPLRFAQDNFTRLGNDEYEVEGIRKNGSLFPMRLSIGKLEWEENRVLVCTVTDLTLAKKLIQAHVQRQAAETANREKTAFISLLSHELRNPLGAIHGYSELTDGSAEELKDSLRVIHKNSEYMLLLLNDLLDISRIEAGKLQIESIPFRLNAVLEDVVSVLRFKADRKGIEFRVEMDKKVPGRWIGDPLRIKQVLINLIGNAIKFTHQGRVVLSVHASQREDGRSFLEFLVEDTGVGISLADQKNLFQAFSQADRSIARRFGGSGLGLMLSRQLARRLGGDVELVHSIPGRGSIFKATLQVQQDFGSTERVSGVTKALPEFWAGTTLYRSKRILIIEDQADFHRLYLSYLRPLTSNIVIASDGEEGIRLALEQAFDLIVLDIQLPKMDGWMVLSKLRESGVRIPVIGISAQLSGEGIVRDRGSRFDDFLLKPIRREDLLNRCRTWLERGSRRMDLAEKSPHVFQANDGEPTQSHHTR